MSGKLSRTVLRRRKGSNPFSLVDYTSYGFKHRLDAAGIKQSMSRVGKCIDNGPMEAFWGILKCEKYYIHKYHTFKDLSQAIDDYIYFYNTKRLQKRINGLSPMEFRALAA
ncbi:transposase [Desulfosporosinus sp. SB140]|uniref:transposase n=1 Tax=Desulfosporosinus paludis TaxID=3115649 RepID=UPI003890FB9F